MLIIFIKISREELCMNELVKFEKVDGKKYTGNHE